MWVRDAADDVRPELGLGDDVGQGAEGAQGAAHAAGIVEGIVDEDVIGADALLGLGPARAAGDREDEGQVWALAAEFVHQLAGHGDLAHGDGVNPDARCAVGQAVTDVFGIAPKAVGEAVGVTAALGHAQEELGHHQHVSDGEEEVVEEPFHGGQRSMRRMVRRPRVGVSAARSLGTMKRL